MPCGKEVWRCLSPNLPAAIAWGSIACRSTSGGNTAAAGDRPWFEEIAARAGITFVHTSGHQTKHPLPEIMGGGAALFDLDNDGYLDLYLVQSGSLVDPSVGSGNRMFRNRGDGTFDDVTEASWGGIRLRGNEGRRCAWFWRRAVIQALIGRGVRFAASRPPKPRAQPYFTQERAPDPAGSRPLGAASLASRRPDRTWEARSKKRMKALIRSVSTACTIALILEAKALGATI